MKSIQNVDIKDVVKLKGYGYKSVDLCSQYEVLRLVSDDPKATIILFSSGKLLIQTSRDNEKNVITLLDKIGISSDDSILSKKKDVNDKKDEIVVKDVRASFHSIVGSDESLKGDTFGGIVVCAVFCDENMRKKLIKLKVCDSKLLTDDAIRRIAPQIMDFCLYHVENIYPKEYNKFEVTPLLNRLHKLCYDNVVEKIR